MVLEGNRANFEKNFVLIEFIPLAVSRKVVRKFRLWFVIKKRLKDPSIERFENVILTEEKEGMGRELHCIDPLRGLVGIH